MDSDDLEPRKLAPTVKNLEPMSIKELGDYISSLEAEILRARDAIKRKEAVRAGAEAFFKR